MYRDRGRGAGQSDDLLKPPGFIVVNAFPLPSGAVFVTPSGTLRLAEQPHWTGENIEVHRGRGDLPEARELIIYRIEARVPTTAPPTSSHAVGREFRPRVAGGVPRGLAVLRWRLASPSTAAVVCLP